MDAISSRDIAPVAHPAPVRRCNDAAPAGRCQQIQAAATRLEAVFLAEMLRHAGVGAVSESFGGGAGEKAFAGTLVQEYAGKIADSGGLGLADTIFRSLIGKDAP